jgi:hypothetical protein
MSRHGITLLAGLALATGLLACGHAAPPGPSISDRATSLAQTAAALLTSTAVASITPITPTLPPTATPVPPTATLTPVPATSRPTPTVTPTPCAPNDSDFVADVTIPDGKHEPAGAAFTKTWRLSNSGQCAWTTAYSLRNVGGEVMGGVTIHLPHDVPVGATVDLSIDFVAPTSAGKHISRWQLFTADDVAFGTKPFLQIMVP